MRNKRLIQFLLILSIILVSWFFYSAYLKKNQIKNLTNTKISNEKEIDQSKNSIKNIIYESEDSVGRKYVIKSEEGIINDENTDIIFMTNVSAQIILLDGSIIFISAKNANYDNNSFNTKFEKEVKLNFLDHKVASDNLDIFFDINILEAYNNLVYKNSDIVMYADKITLDLISKNSKIYKLDEGKVKILSLK